MIEFSHLAELEKVKSLPQEVQKNITRILHVLDSEYGTDRNQYEDNGGYVILVENQKDFKGIMDKAYIDCNTFIPEYVDKIVCSTGEIFTNSLMLLNSDYSISLIIPIELTPQNLKNYIIEN